MSPIRKALVVDDDDDVLRLCKVSLQTFTPWKVAVAKDAAAALGAALREASDVILLDVMMPDGGGLAIMGKLKGESTTAAIPIVLMTAADTLDEDGAGEAAGIILKPFDPVGLSEQIVRIVDAHKGRHPNPRRSP
jgi:two-component system OmpR family response regulator